MSNRSDNATGCLAFGAKRRWQRGLTLTELIISLVLVGVLASLLFQGVQRGRQEAWKAQCLGKMKQLGAAAHLYIAENRGRLPFVQIPAPADTKWAFNIAPYLGLHPTSATGSVPRTDAFLCPADPSKNPKQLRTYRYHQSFPSPQGSHTYGRQNYVPSYYREIVSPSTHAMIFCIAIVSPTTFPLWHPTESFWKKQADINNPPDSLDHSVRRPHYDGKAVSVLYSDGHVAKATYPLNPLLWHFDGQP